MFDQVILSIDHYFVWLSFLISVCKVAHIIVYKGVHPRYIFNTYFIIFSGVELSGSKNYNQRLRFRQIHNLLTIAFYAFLLTWLIIHFTLRGGITF